MKESFFGGVGVTLKDPNHGEIRVHQKGHVLNFSYPCSNNFTCTPYIVSLPIGIYFFRAIGGSGGFAINGFTKYRGGYGGVSEGVYKNNRKQRVYLFIGGSGECYIDTQHLKGGYNGGGTSFGRCGGGGGSTDIRINEDLTIDTRIIVAGGGGGGRDIGFLGGNGGGNEGEQGFFGSSYRPCYGSTDGCVGGEGDMISNGARGIGGDGLTSFGAGMGGGGGGSGYYGGGSAANSAGSGGSGYIGSLINFNNYSLGTYFSEHEGNGYATITIIESSSFQFCSSSSNHVLINIFVLLYSHTFLKST